MVPIRGQVDELTGLDQADLPLAPALKRAIQNNEAFRVTISDCW